MSSESISSSLDGRFQNGDIWKSAEAVVDAAMWCHRACGRPDVSDDVRDALVAAVYEDASLTAYLFDESFICCSWC